MLSPGSEFFAMKGTIEKIKCDRCTFANEPERIFCHECGARLDRSEYQKEVEKRREREAREAPERLRKSYKKAPLVRAHMVALMVVLGLITGVLVQAFRPPDPFVQVPPDEGAQFMVTDFKSARFDGTFKEMSYTQEELNQLLDAGLDPEAEDGFWANTVSDANLLLNDGEMTFTAERKIIAPFYFTATFEPAPEDDGSVVKPKHFAMGRLRLPSFAAPMFDRLIGDIPQLLKIGYSELESIRKMEFQDERLVVNIGPASEEVEEIFDQRKAEAKAKENK